MVVDHSRGSVACHSSRNFIKPHPVASWYNFGVDVNNRPEKPQHLSEYAILCLEALSWSGLADRLSLGGIEPHLLFNSI